MRRTEVIANILHPIVVHAFVQAKKRNFWHGAGTTGPVGGRYRHLFLLPYFHFMMSPTL